MDNSNIIIKFLPWALIAAAAGPLGTAYIAEFAFGYEPCVLCLYQRIPYGIIAMMGIATLFVTRGDLKRHLVLFAGLVFFVGTAVALYHVGGIVQRYREFQDVRYGDAVDWRRTWLYHRGGIDNA